MIIISDEVVLLKNYNEKIISQYAKKFSNMELLDPAYEKISDYDINTIDFNFTSIINFKISLDCLKIIKLYH